MRRRLLAGAAAATVAAAAAGLGVLAARRRSQDAAPASRGLPKVRLRRGLAALHLVARGGAGTRAARRSCSRLRARPGSSSARTSPWRPPQDVAQTLGAMKGVLMKIGQMASYIDDGLSPGRAPDAEPAAGQRPADEP